MGVFPLARHGRVCLRSVLHDLLQRFDPVLFLLKAVRRSIPWLFVISLAVNFGMWWERFVIIVGGVAHDFAPHAWGLYAPGWWSTAS